MTAALIVAAAACLMVLVFRAMRDEAATRTDVPLPARPDARRIRLNNTSGCLVAIAAVIFSALLVFFTVAYDNPFLAGSSPAWVEGFALPFRLAASIIGIWLAPLAIALGLAAALAGGVKQSVLSAMLLTYIVIFTGVALGVILDAWFARSRLGELANLWFEFAVTAAIGDALLLAMLFASRRAAKASTERPSNSP